MIKLCRDGESIETPARKKVGSVRGRMATLTPAFSALADDYRRLREVGLWETLPSAPAILSVVPRALQPPATPRSAPAGTRASPYTIEDSDERLRFGDSQALVRNLFQGTERALAPVRGSPRGNPTTQVQAQAYQMLGNIAQGVQDLGHNMGTLSVRQGIS